MGWDFLSDLGGGISGIFNDPMAFTTALLGGSQLIGGLTAPEPQQNYATTKEYADLQAQLTREELAQRMQIAQMNAASAGAGSGAAIAAAKIAAGVKLKEIQEQARANALAARLKMAGEVLQQGRAVADTALQKGQLSQQGFQGIAAALQNRR